MTAREDTATQLGNLLAPPSPPSPSTQDALARAEALFSARRIPEALLAFEDPALAATFPDATGSGRWHCHMLLGNFAAAWRENDGFRQRSAPDPHRMWDGSPLAGQRVMLRCLHGLGDAIQLVRFAPALRAVARELIVEVPPALLDLAPYFVGPDQVITWGEAAPTIPPAWDRQIEVMELPYFFRAEPSRLPAYNAGLRLPPDLAASIPDQPGRPLRVGLAWTGGTWDTTRSTPFALLQPLLELAPTISLASLQPSSSNADWTAATDRYGLKTPAGTALDSLLLLARFIAGLDLVITVDTLAAHLAGALGRPVWILLQHEADWRWMLNRRDSPWYPSVRLYRQRTPGDWPALIDEVRRDLITLTNDPTPLSKDRNHARLG